MSKKTRKFLYHYILWFGLCIGFILGVIPPRLNSEKILFENNDLPRSAMEHDALYIDGNAELTNVNGITGGIGTKEDPYRIENWVINTTFEIGIMIENTDAYIKITNCIIQNKNASCYYPVDGIGLYNTSNIIICDNFIQNYSIGIKSIISRNVIITNNEFLSGFTGIDLNQSDNFEINENELMFNGIGISICNSNNNSIMLNVARKNRISGISLYGECWYNLITQNIISHNNYAGIELFNLNSYNIITNNLISNNNVGVTNYNSHENSISNNMVTNNCDGIRITKSNNTNVMNNQLMGNQAAVSLISSNSSIIENNFISKSWRSGIEFENSNYNKIIWNIISEDDNYGITLEVFSNFNTFMNNFLEFGGFFILNSGNNTIDRSNKINGKSICYYENQNAIEFSGEQDVGQIILYNCSNFTIENMQISNTSTGISIIYGENNTISNISVINCIYYGFFIMFSNNNTIQNCMGVSNLESGIALYYSNNNSIQNNYLTHNRNSGILFAISNFNKISNNSIMDNNWCGINMYYANRGNLIWSNNICNNEHYEIVIGENTTDNQWFFGDTGNFYGDYLEQNPLATHDGRIWATPYQMGNSNNNFDYYPLVNPIQIYFPSYNISNSDTLSSIGNTSNNTGSNTIQDITNGSINDPIQNTYINEFFIISGMTGVPILIIFLVKKKLIH